MNYWYFLFFAILVIVLFIGIFWKRYETRKKGDPSLVIRGTNQGMSS